jgi:hypothetical protein
MMYITGKFSFPYRKLVRFEWLLGNLDENQIDERRVPIR